MIIRWPAFIGDKTFDEMLFEKVWDNILSRRCLCVHTKIGLFLSVCVDDSAMFGRMQNMDSLWKILQKKAALKIQHHAQMIKWLQTARKKVHEGYPEAVQSQTQVVQKVDDDIGG